MMLGPIVDTILGLFFVYALFGLVNTIIVETIPRLLSVFKWSDITRARMLQLAVFRMLGGVGKAATGGARKSFVFTPAGFDWSRQAHTFGD